MKDKQISVYKLPYFNRFLLLLGVIALRAASVGLTSHYFPVIAIPHTEGLMEAN